MSKIDVLDDVIFGNPSFNRITIPTIPETLRGSVSTLATVAQQFAAVVSLGVLYTAGGDGKIWRYDAAGNATVLATLGGRILDLVADGTTLYATQDQGGRIWRINALTGAALDWVGLGATALALGDDGMTLYAVAMDGTLAAINIPTGAVTPKGNMGQNGAIGLAYDAARGLLYTSTNPLLQPGAPAAVYRTHLGTNTSTQVIAPSAALGPIWGCTLGNRGETLYLGSFLNDGRVWRWNTATLEQPTLLAGAVAQGLVDGKGAAARFANPVPSWSENRLIVVHGSDTGGIREIQ